MRLVYQKLLFRPKLRESIGARALPSIIAEFLKGKANKLFRFTSI